MLAIWPEIAQIVNVVLIGETALLPLVACLVVQAQALQLVELALAMLLTARWR